MTEAQAWLVVLVGFLVLAIARLTRDIDGTDMDE